MTVALRDDRVEAHRRKLGSGDREGLRRLAKSILDTKVLTLDPPGSSQAVEERSSGRCGADADPREHPDPSGAGSRGSRRREHPAAGQHGEAGQPQAALQESSTCQAASPHGPSIGPIVRGGCDRPHTPSAPPCPAGSPRLPGYDAGLTNRAPIPTELRTARLLLRQPRLEDVDAYLALERDPEYAIYGSRQSIDREGIEWGLARIIATPWEQRAEFAIVLNGLVIGRAILDVDRTNVTGALGYGVSRACWGRGIATEAARAVMEYGFEAFGLAKVWARVDPRNVASVRVLEKLGMQREGLLRDHLLVRGERMDRAYYGILRAEWETLRSSRSASRSA